MDPFASVSEKQADPTHCGGAQQDASYYFIDLIILVEDTLFRVPRHYFEQNSEIFRDMFQFPVAEGTMADGSEDGQPLRLDGVVKSDFLPLLKFMFPTEMNDRAEMPQNTVLDDWRVVENKETLNLGGSGANRGPLAAGSSSWKEWASILKLSAMWNMEKIRGKAFERVCHLAGTTGQWADVLRVSTAWRLHEIRERAIEELNNKVQDMNKLKLAIECGVEEWLVTGYLRLVRRSDSISKADEELLGQKTTYKLFLLRHRLLQGRQGYSSVPSLIGAIRRAFQEELKEVNNGRSHITIPSSLSSQRVKGTNTSKYDRRFYFTSAAFIVEDTIFRVPLLYFVQHSKFFRDIFSHPGVADSEKSPNRLRTAEPLRLDGVTKSDFCQLLRVMFLPATYQASFENAEETDRGTQKMDPMSWRDWASVYHLSNKWGMETIRDKALQKMSSLPANLDQWIAVLQLSTAWGLSGTRQRAIDSLGDYDIDGIIMVELAKQCKVLNLLLRGYHELVRRHREISVEEAERLGWETALSLLRIRDRYLSSLKTPVSFSNRAYDPVPDLHATFQVDLEEATAVG